MLAHAYRYILFIILGFGADVFYARVVAPAWHTYHLAGIWASSSGFVNDLYVRMAALVAFHVVYGCAFAYFTTDLHNNVPPAPPFQP